MTPSIVFIRVPRYDYEYRFAGVTQIRHSMTVKTATDTDSESEEDYINGARNQPNKVTLTVMETDITQSAGWASRMMNALEAVKRSREVCQVITPLRAYENMLLTDFTVTQDETTPYGWSGTLVFTETNGGASTRRYSNSSRITDVAAIRAYDRKRANRSLSQSSLRKMLQRAGISRCQN